MTEFEIHDRLWKIELVYILIMLIFPVPAFLASVASAQLTFMFILFLIGMFLVRLPVNGLFSTFYFVYREIKRAIARR